MNAPLSDDLLRELRADGLPHLGAELGLSTHQTDEAVAAALPLLFGAMVRAARRPGGADALFGAMARDHRGEDPGNVLGTALAGGGSGEEILRHLLGRRTPVAAQTLGSIGDIGEDRASMLLRVLAPVALAYVARRMFMPRGVAGPDAPEPSAQGLCGLLEHEDALMRSREGFGAGLASVLEGEDEGEVDLQDFLDAGKPPVLGVETPEMRSPRPLL